jgi:hypothetical protein
VVRRVGYAPTETTIEFARGQRVDRRIALSRVTTLDSVVVVERTKNLSFEDHRKLGLGHFVTREEIDKNAGALLVTFLQQMPGMKINRGMGTQTWPLASRPSSMNCTGCYIPEPFEAGQGMRADCYALVFLDGMLMNRPQTFRRGAQTISAAQPFDLRDVSLSQVESVEWYARASQMPVEYNVNGSACGVLVIWTRKD